MIKSNIKYWLFSAICVASLSSFIYLNTVTPTATSCQVKTVIVPDQDQLQEETKEVVLLPDMEILRHLIKLSKNGFRLVSNI